MRSVAYFLITPRPILIARLSTSEAAELADLRNPVLWSDIEYDKGLLLHSDFELLAKLLFLDTLRRERKSDEAFSAAFAELSISGDYFDSLWKFERILLETVEEAISLAIEADSFQEVLENSNDRIKEALSDRVKKGSNA